MCDDRNQCIAYEFDNWYDSWEPVVYDFSDEENCNNWTCSDGFWKCEVSNICIEINHLCNGIEDCVKFPKLDTSDERNCEINSTCEHGSENPNCEKHTCMYGLVLCNGSCINELDVCDGLAHDQGRKDELCCTDVTCDDGFWKCETNEQCILSNTLCDGHSSCLDNSDEKCRSKVSQRVFIELKKKHLKLHLCFCRLHA